LLAASDGNDLRDVIEKIAVVPRPCEKTAGNRERSRVAQL
jgi:hypothetical protein